MHAIFHTLKYLQYSSYNNLLSGFREEHRGMRPPTLPQLPLLAEQDQNTLIEQSLIPIKQSPTLTEFVIISMLNSKLLAAQFYL